MFAFVRDFLFFYAPCGVFLQSFVSMRTLHTFQVGWCLCHDLCLCANSPGHFLRGRSDPCHLFICGNFQCFRGYLVCGATVLCASCVRVSLLVCGALSYSMWRVSVLLWSPIVRCLYPSCMLRVSDFMGLVLIYRMLCARISLIIHATLCICQSSCVHFLCSDCRLRMPVLFVTFYVRLLSFAASRVQCGFRTYHRSYVEALVHSFVGSNNVALLVSP